MSELFLIVILAGTHVVLDYVSRQQPLGGRVGKVPNVFGGGHVQEIPPQQVLEKMALAKAVLLVSMANLKGPLADTPESYETYGEGCGLRSAREFYFLLHCMQKVQLIEREDHPTGAAFFLTQKGWSEAKRLKEDLEKPGLLGPDGEKL